MVEKQLEFIVCGLVQGDHFTVIGRCGDLSIHVGDVFDVVYRNKRRRYPDEMGDDPVREVEKPAAIRVLCIHAYQRSLQTLGGGHTGSLTLEGDGTQYLAPGWILGRRSEAATITVQESEAATATV
jgi:hypothetical protein